MPELPEVETVVRGLRDVLPGRRIIGVRLGKTDFMEDPAAIERELPGSRVKSVWRHGKFIVVDLEKNSGKRGLSFLIHLGMTGQLVGAKADAPVSPHTHAFFALNDGRELRYTDIRRFGSMRVLVDGERERFLGEFGLDALETTQKEFISQLKDRRAQIKALLLNQSVLRGMGNIYTDESLWRAKIHPRRLATSLSHKELVALYRAVQKILREAIRLRGSSVSNYVDCSGQPGEFQQKHRAKAKSVSGAIRSFAERSWPVEAVTFARNVRGLLEGSVSAGQLLLRAFRRGRHVQPLRRQSGALELDGRVRDLKIMRERFADVRQYFLALFQVHIGNAYVAGKRVNIRPEGPDVNVVHLLHAIYAQYR